MYRYPRGLLLISVHFVFVLQIVIDKEYMHCINQNPQKSDYLLIFQEFMNRFFPNVSIYPTGLSVFASLGITTYVPNL